jgi:secretion/DNA translocation related CpaE-like protein
MNMSPVIGVLAGCGGAGASTFAAVLAGRLSRRVADGSAYLIDCDCLGGGLDVLLGCEQVAGPRWSQVRLRGGELAASVLRADLPRWNEVSFLAADTAESIDPDALLQVVTAAVSRAGVVLDLPRWPSPVRTAAIAACDLLVLVTPAEIRSVTSSALVARSLEPADVVLAVRGSSKSLTPNRIGAFLGLGVIGELPYDPAGIRPDGLNLNRIRKATGRVADAVLDLAWARTAAA